MLLRAIITHLDTCIFEKRQHFITIGNFLHPPNFDAVLHLKQNIWPLIKKQLPEAEMHLYGAYESQKVSQLNNKKEGFIIKGFAEDVNATMQSARVCLAPLRYGAGLKGKLIDAMKNGTPSVMSSIAAEGMFGNYEVAGLVDDSPSRFAQKSIDLYQDKNKGNKKQNAGFNIINQRFNVSNFTSDFAEKIAYLFKNLVTHRQQNFTGQLLMHHYLQSTKYMSKWIEEKNK